jgi:hypothetical protein
MSDMTKLKTLMRSRGIDVSAGDAYTLMDHQHARDFKFHKGQFQVAKMLEEMGDDGTLPPVAEAPGIELNPEPPKVEVPVTESEEPGLIAPPFVEQVEEEEVDTASTADETVEEAVEPPATEDTPE